MIASQRPMHPGVGRGPLGNVDTAVGAPVFDSPRMLDSLVKARGVQNMYGQMPQTTELQHDQPPRPTLKRKRSIRDDSDSFQPASTTSQPTAPIEETDEASGEPKRTKLGYHRTSVACGHCRRRKIRCLIPENEPSNRCANCIKLKKDCSFHPVDQSTAKSKAKPAKGNGLQRKSIALSPTSTVPPPKRWNSDGSVAYSLPPSSLAPSSLAPSSLAPASLGPRLFGYPNQKLISSQPSRSIQGTAANMFQTSVDSSWFPSTYQPAPALNGPTQQPNFGVSPGNGTASMWDSSPVSSVQVHQRSPSWHDYSQPAIMTSPQSAFTSPAQKYAWSRPPQRSISHPGIGQTKSFLFPENQLPQSTGNSAGINYSNLMGNQTLMQAPPAVSVTQGLPASTISEASLMPVPTINISPSATQQHFTEQHSWPMFTGQEDNAGTTATFDDEFYANQWYQM